MGAELGATTSIFPADEQVHKFLKAQGREDAYIELLPDEDAEYDDRIEINLSELEKFKRLVDAMCAKMMDASFNQGMEVIVLPNLYGDIVTDVAAEHAGGLGTACSSNIGNQYALFEAIHGTAPYLMSHGRGEYANPCSLIRAVGQMLIHIGYADRNQILEEALDICTVTEKKLVVTTETKDASAAEFTDYLLDTIRNLKK